MNAWEWLRLGSSLGDGFTAYDYLINPRTGEGTVLVSEVELTVDCLDFEVEIDDELVEINVASDEVDVIVDDDSLVLEICDD